MVFSLLPLRDIKSAALVCRDWRIAVDSTAHYWKNAILKITESRMDAIISSERIKVIRNIYLEEETNVGYIDHLFHFLGNNTIDYLSLKNNYLGILPASTLQGKEHPAGQLHEDNTPPSRDHTTVH